MIPNGIVPLAAAALVLTGCAASAPRSAYDIVAAEFGPDATTRCERYAYESGRTRYELQSRLMGQAFASTNANQVAREAFARCTSGRGFS